MARTRTEARSATTASSDDDVIYNVVTNVEEQYSIWPANEAAPARWTAVGISGTKSQCLAYIESVWTDMRPRSVRLSGE